MEKELKELSSRIVNDSLKVKENEKVLITFETKEPLLLVKEIVKDIYKNGAVPFVKMEEPSLSAVCLECTNDERIKTLKKIGEFDVDTYDCFINIKYTTNDYEHINVDKSIHKKIGISLEEVDDIRINQRRWVLLNYPSKLDAYKAKMSSDDYFNYAIKAMNFDYDTMYQYVKPLKKLMENTDKVRIIGPNTDITFSINGMPAIPCCCECNIPDGEIFTAPIKDSVNGIITYNTDSPYQGEIFKNISLVFKDGKIIEATCDGNNEKLNDIFNTDDGAKYIGEFSFGLNPLITKPMGDILFDEKIIGSIHFTPGRAYAEAFNGNNSAIHWDLVLIQTENYGGGEIYFDDVLIRKDGKFVLDELKPLNYDIN